MADVSEAAAPPPVRIVVRGGLEQLDANAAALADLPQHRSWPPGVGVILDYRSLHFLPDFDAAAYAAQFRAFEAAVAVRIALVIRAAAYPSVWRDLSAAFGTSPRLRLFSTLAGATGWLSAAHATP